jgi:hypothetical protein
MIKNEEIINKILEGIPEVNQPGFRKTILDPLLPSLPQNLRPLLLDQAGVAKFLQRLPKAFEPESVLDLDGKSESNKGKNQRAWELVGYFYRNLGRSHESIAIFSALYNHMLIGQSVVDKRGHKGVPLVNLSDCYNALSYPVLAKRYLMLTLCEDAITFEGKVPPNISGIYYRLVWQHGMSHEEISIYSKKIYQIYKSEPKESRFPEWVLQKLDQNWMVEIPAPQEALIFTANKLYISNLISGLGEGSGKNLESLAAYLLSCMPGCKTYSRVKTQSSDLDVICSLEGFDVDFRSELGRYFVCECKDWTTPADVTTLAKFCRVLDSIKSKFGILFSREGISGAGKTKYAEREQLKVFQDRGMVIVVVNHKDLEEVADGANFITMLRNKYRKIRLDLLSEAAN